MTPIVLRSRTEQIMGPVVTDGTNYQWYSAYYLEMPPIKLGSVAIVASTFEITNPFQYNVQCDCYIGNGTAWGVGPQPLPFNPVTGTNVSPEIHHYRETVVAVIDDTLLRNLNLSWSSIKYISLILSAVSGSCEPYQGLVLERGYGEIVASIFAP